MKIRDLRSALRHAGASPVRIRGSHEIWSIVGADVARTRVSVPIPVNHLNDEASGNVIATVRQALRRCGHPATI